MSSLLDAADLVRGVTYTRDEARSQPGPSLVPILRANNISDARLNFDDLVYVPEYRVSAIQRIRKGDIVIAMSSGSRDVVGKAALVRKDWHGGFGAFCGVLRARSEIDVEYLAAFLQSGEYRQQIDSMATGTNINNLSKSSLAAIEIPLAPMKTQTMLSALLQDVELKRANAAVHVVAGRRAMDRVRQAVLAAACSGRLTANWRNAATGNLLAEDKSTDNRDRGVDLPDSWTLEPVRRLFRIQNGRAFPSKEYTSDGVRLVRPGNLSATGTVNWDVGRTVHLPPTWATRFPQYVLGQGELLMNLTAQSLRDEFLGRVCIKEDDQPALLNQRIARFINIGDFDSRPYTLIYFKSTFFRRFVNGLDTGTLIRHMHSKQLEDHLVPYPPVDEQAEIVRRVKRLLKLIDDIQRRLDVASVHTSRSAQALLASAFRGDLVPAEADLAAREGRDYEPSTASHKRLISHVPASKRRGRRARE